MEQSTQPYTAREVASILKVSERAIWRMCRRDELPGVKQGRKWFIKRVAFDEKFGLTPTLDTSKRRGSKATVLSDHDQWGTASNG